MTTGAEEGSGHAEAMSFRRHIAPFLAPYRSNMMWRLDLADYAAVKINAEVIAQVIADPTVPMPPPPLPPLRPDQITAFKQWIADDCPP